MSNYLVTYSRDKRGLDVVEHGFECNEDAIVYIRALRKEPEKYYNIRLS